MADGLEAGGATAFGFQRIHRQRSGNCARLDGPRDSGSRRSSVRSRYRRCRTSAARAAEWSDESLPATARRGSGHPPPSRQRVRWAPAAPGSHCKPPRSDRRRAPRTSTCTRSSEEFHRARGAARSALLAEHQPRLQRLAQLQRHARSLDRAPVRKAKLEMRQEPVGIDGQACPPQVGDDALESPPTGSAAA